MTHILTTGANSDTLSRDFLLPKVTKKCPDGLLSEFKILTGDERELMGSGKVLILEANRNLRLSRIRTLSQEGYCVTGVSSIEEAVKTAKRQSYELLVISVEEPELLNMLLAQFPPELSVLIIATEDTVSKAAECSGTGIHSFLIQPFSTNKFKESVAQTISRTHSVREGLRSKILTDLEYANRLLAAEAEIDRFFELVVEISAAGTKADHVSLALKGEATGKFVIKAQVGDYEPTWERICQQAVKIGEPIVLDETTKHHSRLYRLMAESGISAMLYIPLLVKGDVIGAINHIKVTKRAPFSIGDLNFASILGWWSSIALENARLFTSLQRQHLHVQKLLHEISFAQENERKRMAVEIHDGVAQWIIGASYDIKACSSLVAESRFDDLQLELVKIRKMLQRSVKELRRAIANLLPLRLEENGLVGALRQAAEVLNEEGIRCHIEVDGELLELTLAEESTTYWIAQEMLTNIRKHSKASDASLRMHFGDSTVSVEVSDNGQGFNPNEVMNNGDPLQHIGLLSMKERAELLGGFLSINSNPGKGTTIDFSFRVSSPVMAKAKA